MQQLKSNYMEFTDLIDGLNSGKLVITTAKELNRMDRFKKKELSVNEVCELLNISESTLNRNIKKDSCMLIQTKEGGKGRGNSRKFLRTSVELEKQRLKQL